MRLILSFLCMDVASAHFLSGLKLNKHDKKDGVLTASYETTIDMHVSHITRLFLADELNKEWNSRLSVQRTLSTREHGEIVYHLYDLPWPLSPRELLMKCGRSIDHRANQLTSFCHSVEDESFPKSADAVRVELRHTEWRITSLPDERTHIQLFIEIPASAATAVPNFIVRYCQRSLLRDSVTAFLQANDRLQLPTHPSFIGWQRSRTAVSKARAEMKRARQQGLWEGATLWMMVLATAAAFALVQGALQGGFLGLLFGLCRILALPFSIPLLVRRRGHWVLRSAPPLTQRDGSHTADVAKA